MFIALRDLRFAKGRFVLMGTVVALVALLMVLLTGLSTGLVDDNIGGVRALPADHLAFGSEAGVRFNRSTVERSQWEALGDDPGVVRAAPLGNTLFNGQAYGDPADAARARAEIVADGTSTTEGTAVDLALFGVDPDSFLAPTPVTGSALGTGGDGVLVSDGLVDKGVNVGDVIVLDRVATPLRVVGTLPKANYGHVPVVYAPLHLWQEATFGPPGGPTDGAPLPDSVYRLATVVAVQATPDADLAAADARLGLVTVTTPAAFAGSPGYSEETGTLLMIQFFLYLIAAVLVGAFFTVWTIQRRSEIGLVKALGASNRYLLGDALGQALVVLVGATAAGAVVGVGLGALLTGRAPFALEPGPLLGASALVVVLGLVGATLSVRRITAVDPLIALGGGR